MMPLRCGFRDPNETDPPESETCIAATPLGLFRHLDGLWRPARPPHASFRPLFRRLPFPREANRFDRLGPRGLWCILGT